MLNNLRNLYYTRVHAFRSQQRYLPRAFQLVWEASKWYSIVWFILLILQGLLPVAIIEVTRITIDTIVSFIEGNGKETLVITWGILLACLTIFSTFISTIIVWINVVQGELVKDFISSRIQKHSLHLDLSCFEHPNYFDKLYRARIDARLRPLKLLQNSGVLIQHLLTTIGLTLLIFTYSPWIVPLLILGTLPSFIVIMRYSNEFNQWRIRNTVDERRSDYIDYIISDYRTAAEIRLFQAGEFYHDKYTKLRDQIRQERFLIERKKMVSTVVALTFGLVTAGSVIGWMLLRVMNGVGTLGELVAFYQIFNKGQSATRNVVNTAGSIYNDIHFLENLFEFFELETQLQNDPVRDMLDIPLSKGIKFSGVSFRYPGSERDVLIDFDWEIPAGKVVAIVGENGEGKSTLMKLLCRLYDPTGGKVLWDDVDIKDLPLQDLRGEVTFLFQSPIQFLESVRQNISVGDLQSDLSQEMIEKAAKDAGSHSFIEKLPQQYDTILGKWFGGEELSGGEWQRLALARAFIRQASVVILDEPTSAMDSWAELDWLKRFREISDTSTAIIVTHRFTTAMQADLIYVMRNRQIIEQGTHDELVRQGGHYATSWLAQINNSKR